MPKILLTTLNAKYIHLNLAIRILYDLNKDNADLDWFEFTIKTKPEEIVDHCSAYDIICFSCYIWNITETLAVCKMIKELRPDIKILLGGPEVSYEWEDVIAKPYVDYLLIGEGEIPFEAFVKQYPNLSDVPNLVYKQEDFVQFNKRNVSFDITDLGGRNPYQYDPKEELATKVSYIETSRGCPYKCEFCLASLDNKVRYLPMETIKENLLYLMNHGKTIKFLDRTFNVKKAFTLELFQFILDNHRPGNIFQFEITADIVHPDIIAFVNEKVPPGLFRFEIGIQTVNQESNLEVSRKQNFEKTSRVIRQLEERIEMHLDLIVGLPLEYLSDLKYSFEETFKLYPPELQLGFLKFLKGTPVREKYENYGYVFDPEPPYQVIKSDFMSEEDIYKVTLLEKALEIYWNKKRTPNALRYITENYGIFDFLMGLGAYFETRFNFHKHTLNQTYQAIFDYCKETYNDLIISELLAADYYAYSKMKPQDLFEIEVDKQERFEWINYLKLNHHKYRFAIFPIHFDWNHWINSKEIINSNHLLIITYDGKEAPIIEQFAPLCEA